MPRRMLLGPDVDVNRVLRRSSTEADPRSGSRWGSGSGSGTWRSAARSPARTQLSSGPAQKAIRHSGLPAVRGALTRAFAGSRQPDGTYRQDNVFRYLVARV